MAFLSGPENDLTDFQVEFAGLLMGPGTPYELPPTWLFLDLPPVRSMETARSWADGAFAGPDFADVASWTLPVGVGPSDDGTIDFTTAVLQFVNTCTIQPASQALWVKIPGFPARGIPARVTQRSVPIDLGFGGYTAGAIQLRAAKPVWQSPPRTFTLAGQPVLPVGLTYPLFTASGSPQELTFGPTPTAPVGQVLSNGGNAPAWPVVTITGPTTGAATVTIDGNQVTYGQSIPAGQSVTVDYATGRATLTVTGAPGVDRTYLLTSRQFTPVTGTSTAGFTATGGTATVTTADLWR